MGDWERGQVKTLIYQVGDHVNLAGRWRVRMHKTMGQDGLVVDKMELRSDSPILASASPDKRGVVIFDLKADVSENPEPMVSARFTGEKPEAHGRVLIEDLGTEVVPGITIETQVPAMVRITTPRNFAIWIWGPTSGRRGILRRGTPSPGFCRRLRR